MIKLKNKGILTLLVFLSIIIISLTGCSSEELDQLAIVTSLQLSSGKTANETMLYAEIIQPESGESIKNSTSAILSVSGNDLADCIEKLNNTESRRLYLGHTRLIILEKKYLKELPAADLQQIADFAINNNEIRFNTLLAISEESDITAIKCTTTSTDIKGLDLASEIRKNTIVTELKDLINSIYYYRQIITFPVINITSDNKNNYVSINPDKSFILNINKK